MRFSVRLLHLFAALCLSLSSAFADQSAVNVWNDVTLPFRPINIAAAGDTLWVCGTNEMITESSDGGKTWNVKHQNPDGEVLLNIAFRGCEDRARCGHRRFVAFDRGWGTNLD